MQISGTKPAHVITSSALLNLFEQELSYMLWTEKKQNPVITQLFNKASSKELREALLNHQNSIKEQFHNIEAAFNMIKKPVVERKCEAIMGLIKNAEVVLINTKTGASTDLQIISIVQKLKNQQIVSYNLLCAFATTLGLNDVNLLLYKNLEQATNLDRLLTIIGEYIMNFAALKQ